MDDYTKLPDNFVEFVEKMASQHLHVVYSCILGDNDVSKHKYNLEGIQGLEKGAVLEKDAVLLGCNLYKRVQYKKNCSLRKVQS